jgi:LacI family transcriptional regulator, galactose operon repressor
VSRVTQEQIARATGVSQAAVSTILSGRGSGRLSDDTRSRVLETAERLGYRRPPARPPAPESPSRHIGLLLTEALRQAFTDSYYSAIYAGMEETLWENDYHFVFSSRRDELHQTGAVPKFVRNGQVAGLVVLSATVCVPALIESGLPVVSVGHHVAHPGVDSIYPDNVRGASLAAEHMLELGHREFLVLTGAANNHNFAERVETFEQCVRQSGAAITHVLRCDVPGSSDDTKRSARAGIAALLTASGRPFTAVFAANDYMACGACAGLQDAGVAVPAAVSVVGFLDAPIAAQQEPPLTTIRVPAWEMGRVAARRLLERITHPDEFTGLKTLMPVEIMVRGSTAPAPPQTCWATMDMGATAEE